MPSGMTNASPGSRLPPQAAQLAARGHAHAREGRYDAAERAYRQALALAGADAALLYNLAAVELARGDPAAALKSFEACARAHPQWPLAHLGVGRALLATGRRDAAIAAMEHAAALGPALAEVHNALGVAYETAGDVPRAERALRKALALDPASSVALSNLCDLLGRDGRAVQAQRELEEILDARPDDPAVLFKLGYVKAFLGEMEAAVALTARVTEERPDFAAAWLNLGTFLQWSAQPALAVTCFRKAHALAPNDPVILGNLAHGLLYAGDYAHGWSAYETRPLGVRHASAHAMHPSWGPRWNGQDLRGGTLLVHGEGGFGDVIQFARYAAPARERAGNVVVLLERKYQALARLVAAMPGVDAVVGETDSSAAQAHCSLSSLPYLMWRDGAPCATPMPYAAADPALVARWRETHAHEPVLRVGIAWGGGAGSDRFYGGLVDRRRSIAFDVLEPLFGVTGVRFHSLQKGVHADEWRPFAFARTLVDDTGALDDFADTAAYASSLDLVLTVDTSVAHLAGALGLRTWLLNRFDSCWRWGAAGTTTHWYPSLRIFRQPRFGDWAAVIGEVRDELQRLVASSNASAA